MDQTPEFESHPEEWGFMVPYAGKPKMLKSADMECLEWLKERFLEREGDVITWQELMPLTGEWHRIGTKGRDKSHIGGVLRRLWSHGIVLKFARSHHSMSGRPNYIGWYIWRDIDAKEGALFRADPTAPIYSR